MDKEFSLEIESKKKEIVQIQERIHKTLEKFHFLRYAIISDFYSRKQCQIPQAAETTKQTRIHPAIKSEVGKSPKFVQSAEPAVPSTSTDPRFLSFPGKAVASSAKTPGSGAREVKNDATRDNVKRKHELPVEEKSQPPKIPRYVPPKSSAPEGCPFRAERNKVRKRIIVGNISKWIPLDWREDAASHKWTMYVRGDKDDVDISAFVSKVRFFLHPSYRPNDVVEVTSFPFHLSRRGWGEFPLRVQMHFKNPLNKPMDIYHHLKLDRTYTGLQTLGAETLVDLWIHATDTRNPDHNASSSSTVGSADGETRVERNLRDDGSERPASTSERAVSWPNASASEEIEVKDETTETCETSEPPTNLAPIEQARDVEVKVEPAEAGATTGSNVSFSADSDEPSSEGLRFYISREHDYSRKSYSNSESSTVIEDNVTIEHFSENELAPPNFPASSSTTDEDNAEKTDGAAVVPHRCNGDIRSSSRSSTASNVKNATADDLRIPSGHATLLRGHDDRRHKYSRADESDDAPGNSDDASAEGASIAINGSREPSDVTLGPPKDAPSISSTHLRPLKIHIPQTLLTSNKRILLVKKKNGQLPVIAGRLADGDVKVPGASSVAKSSVPRGTSILKKPTASNVTANARPNATADNVGSNAVATLKANNSYLLNCQVPALKIVDARDPRYNYYLPDAVRNGVVGSPLIDKWKNSRLRSETEDERTTQRARVTLGKDRHKIQSKREVYEAILGSIDHARITDAEALVRFVARRLPIVTRNARDPEYRSLHLYACRTEEDFLAYNVGKQRALEWHRAKTIRDYLREKSIPDDQLWSVKEIMMWTRLHGYTPSRGTVGVPEVSATKSTKRLPDSSAPTAVVSTCTEPVAFHDWLRTRQQKLDRRSATRDDDDDAKIDVENVDGDPRRTTERERNSVNNDSSVVSSTLVPLELDESLMPLHNFVCNAARNIGIKIRPEEIVPGVMYSAASRAIMRVRTIFIVYDRKLRFVTCNSALC